MCVSFFVQYMFNPEIKFHERLRKPDFNLETIIESVHMYLKKALFIPVKNVMYNNFSFLIWPTIETIASYLQWW